MRILKVIGFTLLLIIALCTGIYKFLVYRSNHVIDNKNLIIAIDNQANRFIKEGNAIGMVIGVYKHGKTFIKGYGTIDKQSKDTPDSLSIFELASTSKLFTTSTVQLLVNENQITLGDKIQSFLTNQVVVSPLAQHTTLLHLATHSAGFPSIPNSFLNKMTDERNPYNNLSTQDIYDYLKNCEGKKTDGNFEYSNFGMGLLGHIIALKNNCSYEQLVKRKLLQPLQMKHTFISMDDANSKKIVQGFDENDNPMPIWTDTVLTGAGSFLSNASDMIKFIKANLNENETSISASLIQTHQQQLNGETGLGWILPSHADKLLGNKDIVWHNGMAGGYASFIAVDKKNSYGVIILSNKAIDVSLFGMKLTRIIRTQSFKE